MSVVLQVLVLHGGKCAKDLFCHQLFDKLDTDCFGSRAQIITDLKHQKWIEEEKESKTERLHIKLGPRATIETSLEEQYFSAFHLVNGCYPNENDRGLQKITEDKRREDKLERRRDLMERQAAAQRNKKRKASVSGSGRRKR